MDRQLDWFQAEDYCQGWGGHLVSVHSSDFNGKVQSLAQNTFGAEKYWIGMKRNSQVRTILPKKS